MYHPPHSLQLAHVPRFIWTLPKQNFLQKPLPHLSINGFPREELGKAHFMCHPPLLVWPRWGWGSRGCSADLQLCAESRKPKEKRSGSSQGFFLSSHKASPSCSKFLMTTFHLKSSLALKEANFDSTASQDNLARKYSEFNILFFF